jgi:FixJ family two-component response regulator
MSPFSVPTVAVVDDDEPMCRAIERTLRGHGFRVRAYTSSLLYLRERDAVDAQCVVADINMPELDGVGMHRAELESGHDVPTVFISGQVDVPTAVRAMKEGAIDLLEKPVEEALLLRSVRRGIARSSVQREARLELEGIWRALSLLTPREAEVCALVASGRKNKHIARLIGTTEKTVKVHRARVMEKLDLDSLAELVRLVDRALDDSSVLVMREGDPRRLHRSHVLNAMTSALATAAATRDES